MDIQQLTIVPSDNLVIVNDRVIQMPVTLPANVHAVQWIGEHGHIEYNDGSLNTDIGSVDGYREVIAEHGRLAALADAPQTEAEKYAELVSRRDAKIAKTDWLVLRDIDERLIDVQHTLSAKSVHQLTQYRQALRELPEKFKTSEEWEWPTVPDAATQHAE